MIKEDSGYTLIELLVVIMIIGLLTSLLVVNFNNARERARDVQRKTDLQQIKKALSLYNSVFGELPDGNSDGQLIACGPDETPTACVWGSKWERKGEVYMNPLPKDPQESQKYFYLKMGEDNFLLQGTLENKSDKEAAESQENCGIVSLEPANYLVCQ